MNIVLKRIVLTLVVLLSLPVLFQIYQPLISGAVGAVINIIGFFLSPIILFAVLVIFVVRAWKK
jgi:hypothetical protein